MRPRLLRLLAGSWKAAVLSAPAGYGKSTLAAQFAGRFGARPGPAPRVLGCRLHAEDRDPAHLLGTLLAGGCALRPPIGARTRRLFVSRRDMERDGRLLTASFLSELIPARGERLVVLDDVHVLAEGRTAAQWLGSLLEESGPAVRFLLTCRGECPVPLARAELERGTVRLKAQDLLFTGEEEERLLTTRFRLQLGPRDHAALREAVRGWAAGIVLTAQQLRRTGRSTVPLFARRAEPGDERVFAFLAEEVFTPLPAWLRRALCRASVLDDLDPEPLAFLLGGIEARRLLREAGRRDLFVSPIETTSAARFHPLFRDYLAARLSEQVAESERRRLRARLARWWMARDQPERAIRTLVEGGMQEEAVRLFEKTAAGAERERRERGLDAVAQAVPAPGSPWLALHASYAAVAQGRHAEAIGLAREAAESFLERRSYELVARAFRAEAHPALLSGRPAPTLRHGQELLPRILERERFARGLILSEVGYLWLHAGQPSRAERALERAMPLLRGAGHGVHHAEARVRRATVDFTEGRWERYVAPAREALAAFRRAGFVARAQSLIINLAEAYNYLGEEERALACIDEARSLAPRSGRPALLAFAATVRARAVSEKGDFAEAARLFREAREVTASHGSAMANIQLDIWEGIFERRRGRLPAARSLLDRAQAALERAESPAWHALAAMEAALVRGLEGSSRSALRELAQAERVTRRLGDRKELARNFIFEARLRLGAGGTAFAGPLARALAILATERYFVLLRKEADVAVPLLVAALDRGAGGPHLGRAVAALPDSVRARLDAARRKVRRRGAAGAGTTALRGRAHGDGKRGRSAALVTASGPSRLAVRLLGDFAAQVDGREVRFPRRASESLFAYLVLRRGAPVAWEAVAEALWPGVPASAARNRFDVALSAARRALEPGSGPRGPFRVILTEMGMCRLGRLAIELDAQSFERLARECAPILDRVAEGGRSDGAEARGELERLRAAAAAYGGDLLPALWGAPWTRSERDRLRENLHRILIGLGNVALWVRSAAEAEQAATRVLEEDPLHEEALRVCLRAHAARGDLAAVERRYRAFAQKLERELDTSPSPETVALYQGLTQKDGS